MATVFIGTILNAWPDMAGAPDVPFRVSAAVGMVNALAPAKTISIKGGEDAATALSGDSNDAATGRKRGSVSIAGESNNWFSSLPI